MATVTSEGSKTSVEFSWNDHRKYRHSISKFVTATANLRPDSTMLPQPEMDVEVPVIENFVIQLGWCQN
jgi:hypothetical protein